MSPETLKYRRENNLCYRCGDANVLNKKMCQKHLEESAHKERVKRERRKNKKLCARCGQNQPDESKTICEICLDKNREKFNARKMDLYYERRSSKLCVQCGEPTEEHIVYCDDCKEYMQKKDRDRYEKLRSNNTCVSCGKHSPVQDQVLCLQCKEIFAKNGKLYREKQKWMIIDHYGGKCAKCSIDNRDILTIDHIDGGGTQHRKELKKEGTIFYRWIVKNNFPEGFKVLCFNCNRLQWMENKKGNK